MSPRRSISPVRALTFTLLIPLLVLGIGELSLGLGGELFGWWTAPATQDASGEGALEIWAIGDSYTVGIGADEPSADSYPVVAAGLLQERLGRDVVVRNFARPGQNSSQVVASLERELALRAAPDLVVMLAGINNVRWLGQSGQFCLDEGAQGTAIEGPRWLRSLRLYKVLQQLVRRSQDPHPTALSCALVADGFHYLDKGSLAMASEAFDAALSFNGASRWGTLGKALCEQRLGRPHRAVPLLRRAQQLGLNPPPVSLALRAALRAAGAPQDSSAIQQKFLDTSQEDFSRLIDAWVKLDAGDAAASLVEFASLTNTTGERRKILRGTVVAFAHDGSGWALRRMGRRAESSAAFERANTLGRAMFMTPHLLGWSHLGLALNAWDDGDHPNALEHLAQASRDRSATATARALEGWLRAGSGGQDCAAAVQLFEDAIRAAPSQAQAIEGQRRCSQLGPQGQLPAWGSVESIFPVRTLQVPTLQDWVEPSDTRLLEVDVARADELARAAGSRLVLLGYPEPDAHDLLWKGLLRAGQRAGILTIDSTGPMQSALDAGVPWMQLRIADGHPTTRGYRLMGQQLADELLRFSPDRLTGR